MTDFLKCKNRGTTTLSASMLDSDDHCHVLDGTVFPTTYPFHVTIDDEICEVTDNTTNVLTITRSQESTVAAAHDSGATVALNVTAEIITELQDAINGISAFPANAKTVAASGADYTTIAAALAAASSGDVIMVFPGTYAESNLVLKNNVYLVGIDRELCIISASDGTNPIIDIPNGVISGAQNLTIKNQNVDSPAIRITSASVMGTIGIFHYCYIYGGNSVTGHSVTMHGGYFFAQNSEIDYGRIDISTAKSAFEVISCLLVYADTYTSGNFDHELTYSYSNLENSDITSNATGAVDIYINNSTNIGTIVNDGSLPVTYSTDDTPVDGELNDPISSNWAFDHNARDATASVQGHATAAQITKLDGIATGATKYPDTGEQAFLDADHTKLDGIAAGANLYVHPNHTGDVTSVADGAQTIATAAVTLAKMADLAQDKIIGRATASTGVPETIDCTAAGRALLDDASNTDQRTTLGLGTMATATATDYVAKALFDAQTILQATTDDTPAALTVNEQTIVGRLTSGNIASLTVTQLFYNLIMSLGIEAHGNLGATHTLDMSAKWQHSGTVDQDSTISITDPGVSCICRIRLTKSADATARALTWQKTGGGGTFTWASNVSLSSLTQNAGVYDVILWRVAADTYDCSYITMGF